MTANIYDDLSFFANYQQLRDNPNSANILEELPAFEANMPSMLDKRVLDLGCGDGQSCRLYIEIGAQQVTGIDISENMLDLARQNTSHPDISFHRCSIEDIGHINATFDVIVSSLAMHYVENFRAVTHNAARLLSDGGVFFFSQEHPIFTAPRNGATWMTDADGGPTGMIVQDYAFCGARDVTWLGHQVRKYHRSVQDIINPLIEAGFVIEKIIEPSVDDRALALAPELQRVHHVPDYLMVKARKRPTQSAIGR